MNEIWRVPISGKVSTPQGVKTWKEAIGMVESLEINSELYSYLDEGQSLKSIGIFTIESITGAATGTPKTISVTVPSGYIIETTGNLVSVVTTNADLGNIISQNVINPTGITTGTPLLQYNRKLNTIDPSAPVIWRVDDVFTGSNAIFDTLVLPFDSTVQSNQRITFNTGGNIYVQGTNIIQILSDSTLTANYSIGSITYKLYEVVTEA